MVGYRISCCLAPSVACGDYEELVRLTRSSSVRAGLAQRARIVLLASEGQKNAEIAAGSG
jgi:hypothetical protein